MAEKVLKVPKDDGNGDGYLHGIKEDIVKDGLFDQFFEWYDNRSEYAEKWKERTGGKVVGSLCTYTPEEILTAANCLTVRLLGKHEPQDVTEPYLFAMFCPFSRDTLAQGLRGHLNHLDGVVMAHSCLHLRQTYNIMKQKLPVDFAWYLPIPNNVKDQYAKAFMTTEIERFKTAVEKWRGFEITEEKLEDAIKVMDENRHLLTEVYKLRKDDNPHMTGMEALAMVTASELVDKREANEEIKRILPYLRSRKIKPERGIGSRLIIISSEDDDMSFANMVEHENATMVIDEHCTGTRWFMKEIGAPHDNLSQAERIGIRYCDRPVCPTKDYNMDDGTRTRFWHILKLIKDYKVDGALLVMQKFCDPHEGDMVPLKNFLNERGIPTLQLEFDITLPLGQFKTRLEAMLESIGEEDLFA